MELQVIKDGTMRVDKEILLLENLYDESFYEYSNKHAVEYNNSTYAVNELFYALIQKYLVLLYLIEGRKIDRIDVSNAPLDTKLILLDIAKKKNISVKGHAVWDILKVKISYHVVHFTSFVYLIYLMLRIKHKDRINNTEDVFTVLREKAAITKFKNIKMPKEIEDPWDKNSIYRLFPRHNRLGWVLKSYVRSFSSINEIQRTYKGYLGNNSKYVTLDFYKKRIVHSELYGFLMDTYFQNFVGKTYYTGSNLDRFSVIEEKLAKKHGIKTVCYPHGLEYGFRFPKGFSCDVFYATTDYAAKYLNNLYNTNKFIFDESVITLMYKLTQKDNQNVIDRKVVYFTEPREVEVNIQILNQLIPALKEDGVKVYVKLHPGDNKGNYDGMDVTFLADYGEAMTHVICIARKSTVLLEALYNNSTPISILTNKKDTTIYKTLPSLSSDKIKQTYSVEELIGVVRKQLK